MLSAHVRPLLACCDMVLYSFLYSNALFIYREYEVVGKSSPLRSTVHDYCKRHDLNTLRIHDTEETKISADCQIRERCHSTSTRAASRLVCARTSIASGINKAVLRVASG